MVITKKIMERYLVAENCVQMNNYGEYDERDAALLKELSNEEKSKTTENILGIIDPINGKLLSKNIIRSSRNVVYASFSRENIRYSAGFSRGKDDISIKELQEVANYWRENHYAFFKFGMESTDFPFKKEINEHNIYVHNAFTNNETYYVLTKSSKNRDKVKEEFRSLQLYVKSKLAHKKMFVREAIRLLKKYSKVKDVTQSKLNKKMALEFLIFKQKHSKNYNVKRFHKVNAHYNMIITKSEKGNKTRLKSYTKKIIDGNFQAAENSCREFFLEWLNGRNINDYIANYRIVEERMSETLSVYVGAGKYKTKLSLTINGLTKQQVREKKKELKQKKLDWLDEKREKILSLAD